MISPHWSNISLMISSVAFSGKPPTNTVLQPGGRSRVDGGRSEGHHIMFSSMLSHVYLYYNIFSFATLHSCGFLKKSLWVIVYIDVSDLCTCHTVLTVEHSVILLGFWGNRVQLWQWMISLTTGMSGGTGGGGTRLMPAIMGLMGVMSPRPVSNLWIHRESAEHNMMQVWSHHSYKSIPHL